jgi:hypothetical protein
MKKLHRVYLRLIGLALLGTLVACPTTPAATATPTQEPVGDPIIPITTKVADTITRTSLQAYDSKSGQMRFSTDSPVLQNLAVGDVLASEVSKYAPYGYLRKISSIKRENGEVILETTQASLEEAISHGDIDANFDLKPENLISAKALTPGVTVGLAPQTGSKGLASKEVNISDGMNYRVVINESWVEVEGSTENTTVSAKVTLSGEAYFNARYGIKISIRGPRFAPPRLPKLEYIEGSAGIEQRARMKISGEATGKLKAEKKIGEYRFAMQCVFISVVPVCVQPTLYIKIGVSGELKFNFEYDVEQRGSSNVGVRWDSEKGWLKLDGNPQLSVETKNKLKFDTGLNAEVFTKAEAALLLYGAAGPILTAKAAASIDAVYGRNPAWILRGKLEGEYGFVVDLPILGRLAENTDKLFKLEKEFGRSANTPPTLRLYENSSSIQLGQKLGGLADCEGGLQLGFVAVNDNEDGCNVTVSATSNLEGALAPNNHVFKKAGQHSITLTVKDSQGATATASMTLNVLNTAPTIKLEYPANIIEGEDQVFTAIIKDANESSIELCSSVVWTVTTPDTLSSTTGCTVKIRFPRVGQRSVSARVTDNQAASALANVTVTVQAPPANPYPRIKTSGMYSRQASGSGLGEQLCLGVGVTSGTTIDLRNLGCKITFLGPDPSRYYSGAEIDNPSNEALSYDWKVYATTTLGEEQLRSSNGSSEPYFDLGNIGNSGLVTNPCRVTLKVNAPEANRSKGPITVWSGQCTYSPTRIN